MTQTGWVHWNLQWKLQRFCLVWSVISWLTWERALWSPVGLGFVFQDRPQADCGLTHSRREGKEARKLEGVVGGRTDTIHTVLRRGEERTWEQGRVIDLLDDEHWAFIPSGEPTWVILVFLREISYTCIEKQVDSVPSWKRAMQDNCCFRCKIPKLWLISIPLFSFGGCVSCTLLV